MAKRARWTEQQVNALVESEAKKGNKPAPAPLPTGSPGTRRLIKVVEKFGKVTVVHYIPEKSNIMEKETINIPEGIGYELWKYLHDELNVIATEGQLLDIVNIVKKIKYENKICNFDTK